MASRTPDVVMWLEQLGLWKRANWVRRCDLKPDFPQIEDLLIFGLEHGWAWLNCVQRPLSAYRRTAKVASVCFIHWAQRE